MQHLGLETALTNLNLGYEILRRTGAEGLFERYNQEYLNGEGAIVLQGDMMLKPRVNMTDPYEQLAVGTTINSLSLRWVSATEKWKDAKGEESPVHYQFNMSVVNGRDLMLGVTRDLVKEHLHASNIFSFAKDSSGRISSAKNRGSDDTLLPLRLEQNVLFDDPKVMNRVQEWVQGEGDNCVTKGLATWYPQFLPYRIDDEQMAA
jgi:hypothetical protein